MGDFFNWGWLFSDLFGGGGVTFFLVRSQFSIFSKLPNIGYWISKIGGFGHILGEILTFSPSRRGRGNFFHGCKGGLGAFFCIIDTTFHHHSIKQMLPMRHADLPRFCHIDRISYPINTLISPYLQHTTKWVQSFTSASVSITWQTQAVCNQSQHSTYFWSILSLLASENFSSCKECCVKNETASWK